MAKRGRKKGSTNQVVAHLFGAETMNHIASFKGKTQTSVREQMDAYLTDYAMMGDTFLVLWGMGELVKIVPSTVEVKDAAVFTEDFFVRDPSEPYAGQDE